MRGLRVGMLVAVALALFPAPSAAQEKSFDWPKELSRLERDYALTVDYETPTLPVETSHGAITGVRSNRRELSSYAELFVDEFRRYPAEAVAKTGIKRIVLCKDLAFAGEPRAAIPDYDHTVMYYDTVRAAYSAVYQRATIHHEFFHMIDWKDDHRVYEDAAWSALNRAGFTYGKKHVRGVDRSLWGRLDDSLDGFLNRYAMTGVQEDKAEVFCYLMFDPGRMAERGKSDPVMARKIESMKRLTQSFSPSMGPAYWDARAAR